MTIAVAKWRPISTMLKTAIYGLAIPGTALAIWPIANALAYEMRVAMIIKVFVPPGRRGTPRSKSLEDAD